MIGYTRICTVVCLLISLLTKQVDLKDHIKNKIPRRELDPEFWRRQAEEDLKVALEQELNLGVARNVILFLGDGMGISTVTAARIMKGQKQGSPGEEAVLSFEKFPHLGLIKTYNVDHQVPDSAATATAFLCGVKARYGTIGLDPSASRGHCRHSKGKNVTCILELAQKAGKSTGIVTTARVTHATPAPLYAWAPDREWEADSQLPEEAIRHHCPDIGAQLLNQPGRDIKVLLGGGRSRLKPVFVNDTEHPSHTGKRLDGRDIIEEWIQDKRDRQAQAEYVWNKTQFLDVDHDKTDYLLGLFENEHMQFEEDRHLDVAGEPNLAEMTSAAIKVLRNNKKGYFLLVEGARIDQAHHANNARRALSDTLAFDEAVDEALQLVNLKDTLVIVTSDHSHPLAISSNPTRGNPILGLSDYCTGHTGNGLSDVDGLPFTTLSYAAGPGYHSPRKDPRENGVEKSRYRQAAVVPQSMGAHDGSDVAVYATGPMAHLLHSTHEQHYIFHVMSYAACLDKNARHCTTPPPPLKNKCPQRACGEPIFKARHAEVNQSGSHQPHISTALLLTIVAFLAWVI